MHALIDANLLKVSEVAQLLNVSKAEAYLLVRRKDFPLIELGPHLLRVEPGALEQWLKKQEGN